MGRRGYHSYIGNPAEVPNWALERKTFIGVSFAFGVLLALALSALALASNDKMGQWLATFFSSPVLILLAVALVIAVGLRRLVLGPARRQTVPLKWWVV